MFAKACEIFILDLTLRAWIHTEESKRRTLQVCSVLKQSSMGTNSVPTVYLLHVAWRPHSVSTLRRPLARRTCLIS